MALATKCPHCHTIFRVAADQLKLRGGIVRCGSCKEVFDGNAALMDAAARPAASAAPPRAAHAAQAANPALAEAPRHPVTKTPGAPQEAPATGQPKLDESAYAIDIELPDDPFDDLVTPELDEEDLEQDLALDLDVDLELGADPAGGAKRELVASPDAGAKDQPATDGAPLAASEHDAEPGLKLDFQPEPETKPGYQSGPEFGSDPNFRSGPDFRSEPNFRSEPGFKPDSELKSEPGFRSEYQSGSAFKPEYRSEPEFEPGFLSGRELEPELELELGPEPSAEPVQSPASTSEPELKPAPAADPALAAEPEPNSAAESTKPAESTFTLKPRSAPSTEPRVKIEPGAPNDAAESRREPTFDLPDDEPSEYIVARSLPDYDATDKPPAAGAKTKGARIDMLVADDPATGEPAVDAPDGEPALYSPASGVAAPGAPEVDEPGFVKQGRRRARIRNAIRILTGFGSLLLLIALLAQGLTTFRNQLAAQMPQLKPALESACAVIGCRVELPAQIDMLTVEQGELQTIADHTFSYATVLHNQSGSAQAWPSIELTLNDANDKPVLRRVVEPREYLPAAAELAKGFAPRSEQAVKLYFELNKIKASGYHIAIFYP